MSVGVVYRTCDVGIEGAHGCYKLQSYNEREETIDCVTSAATPLNLRVRLSI